MTFYFLILNVFVKLLKLLQILQNNLHLLHIIEFLMKKIIF